MKIRTIVSAVTAPATLTEVELNELSKKAGYLVQAGYTGIVRELLSKQYNFILSTKHFLKAIENGHVEMVELLFKQGYKLNNLRNAQSLASSLLSGVSKSNITLIDLLYKYASAIFNLQEFAEFVIENSGKQDCSKVTILNYLFSKNINAEKLPFFNKFNKFIGGEIASYLVSKGRCATPSDIESAIRHGSFEGLKFFLKLMTVKEGDIYFKEDKKISLIELFLLINNDAANKHLNFERTLFYTALITELHLHREQVFKLFEQNGQSLKTILPSAEQSLILKIFNESKVLSEQSIVSELQNYLDTHNFEALKSFPKNKLSNGIATKLDFNVKISSLENVMVLMNMFDIVLFRHLIENDHVEILKALPRNDIKKIILSSEHAEYIKEVELESLATNVIKKGRFELLEMLVAIFPEYLPSITNMLTKIKVTALNRSIDFEDAFFMETYSWNYSVKMQESTSLNQCRKFKEIYKELMPIIMLASIMEDSFNENYTWGMIERLVFLFRDKEKIIQYLANYQMQYGLSKKPVHDACLFSLPKKEIWTVTLWSDIVIRLGYKATKLLPWAAFIENKFILDNKPLFRIYNEIYNEEYALHFPSLKIRFTAEVENRISSEPNIEFFKQTNKDKLEKSILKKIQNELAKITTARLRSKIEGYLQNDFKFKAAKKKERIKIIDGLIKYSNLASLSIDELGSVIAKYGYARAAEHPDFARQGILCRMTEGNFNRCLEILSSPKKTDKVPNINIDGTIIGYPRYYLRKLQPDEYLGFILGEKTNCCQSVGNIGEQCALHGMTSEYSSFYVLFEKGTDQVIAQTWVCISKNNRLIYDSIEFIYRYDETMILAFFKRAAEEALNFGFQTVVVGLGGNTPSLKESKCRYMAKIEEPVGYEGYSDSKVCQVVLATTENIEELNELYLNQIDKDDAYDILLLAVRKNNVPLVRTLLDRGIREPCTFSASSTLGYVEKDPLLITCINLGNIELFKMMLVEYHVNPNIRNNNKDTALSQAAALGNAEICKLLCECKETIIANVSEYYEVPIEFGKSNPSEYAAQFGDIDLAQFLLEKEKKYLDEKPAKKAQSVTLASHVNNNNPNNSDSENSLYLKNSTPTNSSRF